MKRTRTRPIPDWTKSARGWSKYTKTWSSPLKVLLRSEITTSGINNAYLPNGPKGQQKTVDENHGLRAARIGGQFKGDIGGEFDSVRSGVICSSNSKQIKAEGAHSSNWLEVEYNGPLTAVNPATIGLPPPVPTQDMSTAGTVAIARCKPTNSVADASVFLGELLREGLPKAIGIPLWKDRTRLARGAGSEYLNSEFGWKPIVSEVQQFARAAAEADRILKQYERDAGRIVRRDYEFPIERTRTLEFLQASDGVEQGSCPASVVIDSSRPMPNLFREATTYRRTWFSGAFTYHLPSDYYSRNELVRMAKRAGPLIGLDLTPEVLWNLTPWTWAIDWFSNAGDVVSNLSDWATDGLVMKYGYLMEHTISTHTYLLKSATRYKPGYPSATPVTAFYERKRRVRASPFGFGVTFEMMTPRQLAIMVALGLTKK